jgi:FKBP-type peptidyl-prolyl cis-trans isomerase SlyD
MQIAKDKVVHIHYTLTDKEGQVLDSSKNADPLAYIHGIGALIPGLESELEGKETGDKLLAEIQPSDAYGEWDENKQHVISKAGFRGTEELKAGMRVQVDTGQGHAVAMVTRIDGEEVTLDLNHPLAGMTLHFDVEVMEVRDATESELDHGHVHGPGGHQH